MNKKRLIQIGILLVIVILVIGVVIDNSNESYKEELSYMEYEKSNRDNYTTFKNNILNELKSRMKLKDSKNWQQDYNAHLQMTSDQFEGPEVQIEKLIYNHVEFHRDSVNKNRHKYPQFQTTFTIHNFQFDPDNRTSGKPDIIVTVVPPVLYEEKKSEILRNILEKIDGKKDNIAPYKTFNKEVYTIVDSSIQIEHIKMDLWLTKFDVTVSTKSWGSRIEEDVNIDNSKEIANQRHDVFEILLKIFPNSSPWYVNDGNSFDVKADMAIGAIYCNELVKSPKDSRNIGVYPKDVGESLPLIKMSYYNNLDNAHHVFNQQESDNTIWNKPIYAIISVPNIGTYRNLIKKGDESVHFSFIMPLLVRGTWDVQIPSSIVPEYKPAPPYQRSLANILLPKWGLGIFGQLVSVILFIVLGLGIIFILRFSIL